MTRRTRMMRCSPEDLFDVLTDGWSYATWVVGAARIRRVDREWPDPGSKIHHSVGAWPFMLSDNTEVEKVDIPREIHLRARAWPTGEAHVSIMCRPKGELTEVTIEEEAVSGPASLIPGVVQELMLGPRNSEVLRRLAYFAESRARRNNRNDDDGSRASTRSHGQ